VSPFAKNIYLSVAWTFKGGPDVAAGLPLAVGVVLCDALAGFGVAGLQLKWPNDLLFEQRKLAGILLEMSGDAAGPCRVVVGVGLNVMMPEAAADAIDQPWADLASAAGPAAPARNVLVAALLERLLPLLANYEATGFAPWRDRWQELDAFRDASVIAEQSGKRIAGTGAGVNDHGSLQLQTRSGLVSLHGGEVSLRRAS
jgi:BirA family biotin operon repressor/biotin-[acetyl-CoA-carboxylase] ligase